MIRSTEVYLKLEADADPLNPILCQAVVCSPEGDRLSAEDDVLQRGKRLYEHEMLMHHAYSASDGIPGISDLGSFAVEQYLP